MMIIVIMIVMIIMIVIMMIIVIMIVMIIVRMIVMMIVIKMVIMMIVIITLHLYLNCRPYSSIMLPSSSLLNSSGSTCLCTFPLPYRHLA